MDAHRDRWMPGTRGALALGLVGAALTVAAAQVPYLLSNQGKLLDSLGEPVPDGVYAMEFRFYDACTGGNLLLTDSHAAVQTRDGIYSVLLGGGNLIPGTEPDLLSVFSAHDVVCLGVQVGTDAEMVPRQQIVSSGFALRAAVADTGSVLSDWVKPDDDPLWTGTHTFQGRTHFEDTLEISSGTSLEWPVEVPGQVPIGSKFRISSFRFPNLAGTCSGGDQNGAPCTLDADCPNGACVGAHPNAEDNQVLMTCYNCPERSSGREDTSQHSWNQTIESTYWDGVQESLEYNWNFMSETGAPYRPFIFRVFTDGPSVDTGYFHFNAWNNSGSPHLQLRHTDGYVAFSRGLEGIIGRSGIAPASTAAVKILQQIDTGNVSPPDPLPNFSAGIFENDFRSPAAATAMDGLVGVRSINTFSGAADGRKITSIATLDTINQLTQTGASAEVTNLYGLRYILQPTGQNLRIVHSQGVTVEAPSAPGAGTTVENHWAILIRDQRGLGSIDGDALNIAPQNAAVGGSATRGNLRMSGGWSDGHLRLGEAHLWLDKTSSVLRFKNGAPTGEGDGAPVHAPPATNSNWGAAYWGSSASAAHDTGDEVCTLAGLICEETYSLGSATPTPCNAAGHATARFLVLCR